MQRPFFIFCLNCNLNDFYDFVGAGLAPALIILDNIKGEHKVRPYIS
jgi:hypothetical protein